MAAGAVYLARRVFLARLALAFVASLLTDMVATVQCLSTGLLAGELGLPAEHALDLLVAEAHNVFRLVARAASACVARLLAIVDAAVKRLAALVLAAELAARRNLARKILHFLATEAPN